MSRVFAILALVSASTPAQSASAAKHDGSGRVAWVTDGDTFRLESGERIRIAGIDAPETHREQARCAGEVELGLRAKDQATSLLTGRDVTFRRIGRSYNRTVATVMPDGRDLGSELVRMGVAAGGRAVGRSPAGVRGCADTLLLFVGADRRDADFGCLREGHHRDHGVDPGAAGARKSIGEVAAEDRLARRLPEGVVGRTLVEAALNQVGGCLHMFAEGQPLVVGGASEYGVEGRAFDIFRLGMGDPVAAGDRIGEAVVAGQHVGARDVAARDDAIGPCQREQVAIRPESGGGINDGSAAGGGGENLLEQALLLGVDRVAVIGRVPARPFGCARPSHPFGPLILHEEIEVERRQARVERLAEMVDLRRGHAGKMGPAAGPDEGEEESKVGVGHEECAVEAEDAFVCLIG
ncbi:hypothetical protein C1T17_04795 [Sphingobium sp. SCG-1]|nr:hypothetical protein C1T17_04795 [Sphingobium sp. SCG-1]